MYRSAQSWITATQTVLATANADLVAGSGTHGGSSVTNLLNYDAYVHYRYLPTLNASDASAVNVSVSDSYSLLTAKLVGWARNQQNTYISCYQIPQDTCECGARGSLSDG